MAINLFICCQVHLLAEGLRRILEEDHGNNIVVAGCGKPDLRELRQQNASLIITDLATFHEIIDADHDAHPASILVISDKPHLSASHNHLQELISRGLVGILPSTTDADQLRKAVKAVTAGELWLDRKTIKNSFCSEGIERSDIHLTKAEVRVLKDLLSGHTNKEIAKNLFISEQTVKSHLNHLYKKFGVSNRVKLAVHVYEMNSDAIKIR